MHMPRTFNFGDRSFSNPDVPTTKIDQYITGLKNGDIGSFGNEILLIAFISIPNKRLVHEYYKRNYDV